MKKQLIYLFLAFAFLFSSCDDIIEKNTPENVFEVFWRTMDENYVYFEEKGVNWDSIYSVYAPQAKVAKTDDDLIMIFKEIIPLFKDWHLYIGIDEMTNISVFYPPRFYDFKEDGFELSYQKANIQCFENKAKHIAYVKVSNFTYKSNKENRNPEKLLESLDCSNGLIIDLRSNIGGSSNYMNDFVSAFYTGKKTLTYNQSRSGKGHRDFEDKIPETKQGKGYISDSVPVVILTRGSTYSAANFVVYILKDIRPCIVMGEPTGGGGGSRCDVILPNGWILGFPYIKSFSSSGKNIEYGFEPDIYLEDNRDIHENFVCIKALEYLDNLQTAKQ